MFKLEKHRSPLMRNLMMCFLEIMKDYKNEIKGLLQRYLVFVISKNLCQNAIVIERYKSLHYF